MMKATCLRPSVVGFNVFPGLARGNGLDAAPETFNGIERSEDPGKRHLEQHASRAPIDVREMGQILKEVHVYVLRAASAIVQFGDEAPVKLFLMLFLYFRNTGSGRQLMWEFIVQN